MAIEVYKAPMPERDSVAGAMRRMKVGETFMIEATSPNTRTGLYATARVVGIRIRTVVRPQGKIQVWRVGSIENEAPKEVVPSEKKEPFWVEPEVEGESEEEFEETVVVVPPDWEMG